MEGYKKTRIIVYDCDGVLFESKKANLAYYNYILREFGKPLINEEDHELVNIAHTCTTTEVLEILFRQDPRLANILKFARDINFALFFKWMKMEPGLMEILKTLEGNYLLSIATNRGKSLNAVLENFKIKHFFKYCVTSSDVLYPKPHPDYLLKIVNNFKASKEEVLYIGDSEVDLITAQEAGINFIAYKNDLIKTPLMIAHHLELKDILGI